MRLLTIRIALLAVAALPIGSVTAMSGTTPAYASGCNTIAIWSRWTQNCQVSEGSVSNYVIAIQRVINQTRQFSHCDVGQVDGIFGEKTLAGVKCYQKFYSLKADGIVGPDTWIAIEAPTAPDYVDGSWDYLNVWSGPGSVFLRVWDPSGKNFPPPGRTYVLGLHGRYVQMNTSAPS